MNTTTSQINSSSDAVACIKRYSNAYQESENTIGLGKTLKKVGIALSVVIALLSLFLINISFLIVINGFVAAFIMFAQFYILGTIISNGGHVHKINIDTAINTSPFLNDELKSQALQLVTARQPTGEEQEKNNLSYPQVVAEIINLRPDMELCVKEASQYHEVNPARFEVLQKNNLAKSNEWLIAKLTKVKGTFRSAYGLMVLEAYRRKIDLAEIAPVVPPDELPKS